MDVLIVANLLLTGKVKTSLALLQDIMFFCSGPIFVLTCKPIRLSRTSIANDATSHLHSNPISTNIMSRPASKTSPFLPLTLLPTHHLLQRCQTAATPCLLPAPAKEARSMETSKETPWLLLLQVTPNTSSTSPLQYSPTPLTLSKFENLTNFLTIRVRVSKTTNFKFF